MANLTNELSAVNTILTMVGQTPVSTLTNARADVRIAQNILAEVSRTIQGEGWNFNTEFNVPLTPDGSGEITLPTNTLRFDLNPDSNLRVAIRSGKLRDLKNRTDVFTVSELKGTIVYLLDYSDLPEAMKHYIALSAAIDYKGSTQGGDSVTQTDMMKLQRAKVNAMRHETDTGDYTIFDNNPGINRSSEFRRWRS